MEETRKDGVTDQEEKDAETELQNVDIAVRTNTSQYGLKSMAHQQELIIDWLLKISLLV